MTVDAERSGGIGAEPMTTGFALRIDALHGEAGQILHVYSLRGCEAQVNLKRDGRSITTKKF
jgi:hypothetical protein